MHNITKRNWATHIFNKLMFWEISLLSYIPDAGNSDLVKLAEKNNSVNTVLLTTEEEGVAICAGADLAGKRSVVCMQSSGVGNCVNFFSFVKSGKFPIFMIISMRGEYGEQNPWQYPMGQAVVPVLKTMGIIPFTAQNTDDLIETCDAALSSAFSGGQASALILSQKFLGVKQFY